MQSEVFDSSCTGAILHVQSHQSHQRSQPWFCTSDGPAGSGVGFARSNARGAEVHRCSPRPRRSFKIPQRGAAMKAHV